MNVVSRSGTAEYYAQYRRVYPQQVVSYLVEQFGLDGRGRLLDGGCGTGQAFLGLANYFEQVIAFDLDEERVRVAQRLAQMKDLPGVTLKCMKAENIGPDLGSFRMAMFAASFHWMDRYRVAELVYDLLEPEGHIVIIAPSTPYSRDIELDAVVTEVLAKWIAARDGGLGMSMQRERHAQVLARTRFAPSIKSVDIYVDETWTIDEIVGWMRSTSFASQAVLRNDAPGFERELRQRLNEISSEGRFISSVEYTVISASKM